MRGDLARASVERAASVGTLRCGTLTLVLVRLVTRSRGEGAD